MTTTPPRALFAAVALVVVGCTPQLSAMVSRVDAVKPLGGAPALGADAILEASRRAYREAAAYEDVGELDDLIDTSLGDIRTHVDFKNAFTRAGAYRLDYRGVSGSNELAGQVAQKAGAAQAKRWVQSGTTWELPLGDALGRATAMTHGAALTVAGHLRDDVHGGFLTHLEPPYRVLGGDVIDDVPCVVVDGSATHLLTGAGTATVWIGRDDHFVRRFESRGKKGKTTVHVRPALAAAIDAVRFDFTPPP